MAMAFDATSEASDEALLARYAAGDPVAARALVARLTPRVFAVARRMLGSEAEAEEVSQDALVRLWRIAPDWRAGEAQVSTWLYRVTVNLCTDRLRRRRDMPLDPEADYADDAPPVEQRLQDADRAAALERALASLPERQRQVVVLRHLEGLSNPEIAEILGLTVEAVESLTARGKRGLKAQLAAQRTELGYGDD
ncbi:MAG: RNA polymerase sigma factor [Rhodobacteraceae bacterium]|nr:RNA polymerase sigma factor [Paracoccaceae bacterium]